MYLLQKYLFCESPDVVRAELCDKLTDVENDRRRIDSRQGH